MIRPISCICWNWGSCRCTGGNRQWCGRYRVWDTWGANTELVSEGLIEIAAFKVDDRIPGHDLSRGDIVGFRNRCARIICLNCIDSAGILDAQGSISWEIDAVGLKIVVCQQPARSSTLRQRDRAAIIPGLDGVGLPRTV